MNVKLLILVLSSSLLINCQNTNSEKNNKPEMTAQEKTALIQKGKKMVLESQTVLGQNLAKTIKTMGTENALAFCSTKAIYLTDSVAKINQVKIKRVSDKNRNPINAANAEETAYIQKLKIDISEGREAQASLQELDGKWVAYYPIVMVDKCLQCHGKKETEILPNTLSHITALYPEDKAFNYETNELRGLWVIEMEQ